MNTKFKKYIEIFIVITFFYYLIYLFSYISILDNYCNKYSQEVVNTKKMNLIILWNCNNNYFCEIWNKKYILWKLSNYKCNKKILNIFEYDFYLNKYKELIK